MSGKGGLGMGSRLFEGSGLGYEVSVCFALLDFSCISGICGGYICDKLLCS